MKRDFTLVKKNVSLALVAIMSLFCCVMHYAVINEKRRQSLIHCQNDCYPGVIRKIRDLFFSTAGLSCQMDVKKYVRTAKNRKDLRRDEIFLTPC